MAFPPMEPFAIPAICTASAFSRTWRFANTETSIRADGLHHEVNPIRLCPGDPAGR
jgi:hypothetical protein